MKLQQHGFAITDALTCVALAPTWPKGYYRLGSALAAVKKYGEAADSMRKALVGGWGELLSSYEGVNPISHTTYPKCESICRR